MLGFLKIDHATGENSFLEGFTTRVKDELIRGRLFHSVSRTPFTAASLCSCIRSPWVVPLVRLDVSERGGVLESNFLIIHFCEVYC